jgi:hypothetical protein
LTLETVLFLGATFFAGAFAVTLTLAAGFFDLAARFTGVAFFGAGFALAALFLGAVLVAALGAALVAVARLAFGFEADFALTARFAALEEVRFAAVRAVDRRKPFERLLLILALICKGCLDVLSSRGIGAQLNIALSLNQSTQVFAGAL